jgi:hypothetical protein
MKTFVDNAGRVWCIQIHVAAVKRVRGLVGVDLFALVDEEFAGLSKLLGDPVSLVDVLYCLCKDEADKRTVTDEDFGRSMGGDALEKAVEAFLAELTDFFPDARVRAALQKILTVSRRIRDIVLTEAIDELEKVDADSLAQTLRSRSGSGPESSESIRARLRSVS